MNTKLIEPLKVISYFYPDDDEFRRMLLRHSSQVRNKSFEILDAMGCDAPEIDRESLSTAAMLHDVGIGRCHAPSILCNGDMPYICHGIIGGEMLREYGRSSGIDMEQYARVCERHTGAGLTAIEIKAEKLPLPVQDWLPENDLEKLVCLADKFFSKSGDMQEKSLERVRASLVKFGEDTRQRLEDMLKYFHCC